MMGRSAITFMVVLSEDSSDTALASVRTSLRRAAVLLGRSRAC